MKFKRAQTGDVKFVGTVEKKFKDYAQMTSNSPESGGILLGRIIDGTADVLVTDISIPTKSDRWGRFFFFRGLNAAQRLVHNAWKASGGTEIYLGEWHTHPEDVPTPSAQDLANWSKIMKDARFEQNFLLFVIVGRLQTSLWEFIRNSSVPFPLGSQSNGQSQTPHEEELNVGKDSKWDR